jgi:hypothetical protein
VAEPPAPALPVDPHRLPPRGEWFAPDAERHLLDRPRFCPMCGESLEPGLTSESWTADERVFLTWCAHCSWMGNVVRFDHVAIDEPEH